MFTGSTLPMSHFANSIDLKIIRDCEFAFVGKIPTRLNARIVPCQKQEHIQKAIATDGIVGIITTPDLADSVPERFGLGTTENPLYSLLQIQDQISAIPNFQWASFDTIIHQSVFIYPGAYIAEKDVKIGEGCVIHPNAVILPRSIIGAFCSIGPGAVVAGDAFEVNMTMSPRKIISQSGGVSLSDHVDIQSKTTIIRSTFGGFTEINSDTKIDCQVHVAHDCKIGSRVRIAACAALSGRVEIGDDSFIGPNTAISNGVKVGSSSQVTIGAVVTKDVPNNCTVSGNFAVDHEKWLAFVRSVR
ncbi:LbetaH domain-containing protein [Oceanicaulis alexandrii]|uniref:hypothetical protein n=1 Tax=Oceanicaulis alexandrii TaxID=153233 RepID=UPI000A01D90A|nr:hypothetical protein [Oceanicaulis alexandrii]